MPQLIHWLSESPALVTTSAVVCGDPTAAVATWDAARVTCPQCLRRCTCGPLVPLCPRCSAFNAAHHRGPTRLPTTLRTEKAFQAWLKEAALAAGWKYYHPYTSIRSTAGYPDTTLVRGPLLRFVELKMPGKRPTAAQQGWLEALGQVTQVSSHVWYPTDRDTILEVLQ